MTSRGGEQRGKACSRVTLTRPLIPPPREASSHPNHLSKALLSDAITLERWDSVYEFGGNTNIQSLAGSLYDALEFKLLLRGTSGALS